MLPPSVWGNTIGTSQLCPTPLALGFNLEGTSDLAFFDMQMNVLNELLLE